MIRCDAVIVGGGPAGSTCAWALRNAGWNVILIDRARFPRDKVCAGWLTPGVFDAVGLQPEEYKASGLTFQEITSFRTGVIGRSLIETHYPHVVSYAIRRCEFDHFLLQRSGACVYDDTPLHTLRRAADRWIVNDAIEAPVVIGAGGHFCPVARHLRGAPDTSEPIVAREAEFKAEPRHRGCEDDAPELFFCHDLEGYGWWVRKGNYLNVGLGRRGGSGFNAHLSRFAEFLSRECGVPLVSGLRWRGHAYFASGAGVRPLSGPGVLLVGDAAGLAYPESGEGIGPAVESARLAADTLIAARGATDVDSLRPYTEAMRRQHPMLAAGKVPRPVVRALGRRLLRSRAFTRRVVLDRWFLRL
jgi:flavin-dependent dehydrogenase